MTFLMDRNCRFSIRIIKVNGLRENAVWIKSIGLIYYKLLPSWNLYLHLLSMWIRSVLLSSKRLLFSEIIHLHNSELCNVMWRHSAILDPNISWIFFLSWLNSTFFLVFFSKPSWLNYVVIDKTWLDDCDSINCRIKFHQLWSPDNHVAPVIDK